MNRTEFLSVLELQLRRKSIPDIAEIIADYTEHFEVGKSANKSEQEIIIELGAVEGIVNEYLSLKSAETADLGATGTSGGGINNRNAGNNSLNGAAGNADDGNGGSVGTGATGANVLGATVAAAAPAAPPRLTDAPSNAARAAVIKIISLCALIFFDIVIVSVGGGILIAIFAATGGGIVACVVSGGALGIYSFTVFGSVLVRLAGLCAALAAICAGIFLAKLFRPMIIICIAFAKLLFAAHKKAVGGLIK
jgi:hypothetical protein